MVIRALELTCNWVTMANLTEWLNIGHFTSLALYRLALIGGIGSLLTIFSGLCYLFLVQQILLSLSKS